MKKGVKYLVRALAALLCVCISVAGTYTTVEATQRLEEATNQTKSGVIEDVSEFLGNYTMISGDGTVSTIPEEQMQEILVQGSEVIEKTLVKEVAKKQLSRETLANLEESIYEIIDLTMQGSDMTDTELSLLKSSVASIIEQNVLDITSEYYDVSERNIEILEASIDNKIKVIEQILDGYDKRLTDLQTDLDTLTVNVQEAEKREDMSKEEIDALQKEVNTIVSELTNLQLKYESYTMSSVATTMLVDGIYDGNKETIEYATKQALANSEAATRQKIEQVYALIGEWSSNVTLAQAVEDALAAIDQNNSDLEAKLKNLQTIFEMEIVSNQKLTDTDIKNMQATISTLQSTIANMSSEDISAMYVQKTQFEQKLAENANSDAQTKTDILNKINELNEEIKVLSGLENVEEELGNLVEDASDELTLVFDTKIQTLQTQMHNSISELQTALGTWSEDTTIAEYLVAAHNAIATNDANQTAQINAAKTALELQIANSKETITDEQRAQLDAAVAILNTAIADETADRQQALNTAQATLEGMINQTNSDLTGLLNQEVSSLTTSLNNSVASINSSISNLNTTLGTWDGTDSISDALKEAQQNSSILNSQLQDTNSELQDTISSLNSTQSSLTATQNSLTNTNTLLSKIQSVVASDSELSGSYTGTLISRMAISEGLINSLQSDLSTANADIATLQSAVSQLQNDLSALQNAVNINTQTITDIQSMLGDQVTFTVVDGVLYINTK